MRDLKFTKFTRWFLVVAIACSATLPVIEANAEQASLFEQQKLASHLLVNMFLEKVDHEDLSIFEHQIKRSDLVPHHVAFVHTLADDELKAQLCFMLAKYIVVPNFENFYVEKITVDMDKDGDVIQVSTHVSPVEQKQDEEVDQDPVAQ